MAKPLPGKNVPIRSITLSLSDIRRIYERLLVHVSAEGEREVNALLKPDDKTDEEFEETKQGILSRAFRVTVTIKGPNGESLFGDDVGIFESPNLPDQISEIYITNIVAYKGVANVDPLNSFEMILDFSKPLILDRSDIIGDPTPNVSHVNILAENDAWIGSISEAVFGVINNRGNNRIWLHRAFIYDFGLLIVGFPAAIYTCWKCSDIVESNVGSISPFLSALVYIYLSLAVIWIYRIFFGYTKWAFPTLELKEGEETAKRHRAFWYMIAVALVGQFLWQLFF